MVEAVSGFVSSDGKFFKNEREAVQYEARIALETILREDDMSFDMIEWIDRRHKEISAYLGANNVRRPVPNPKITR